VTSNDELLGISLAMTKGPVKPVELSVLIMAMLNDAGSPPELVQLIELEWLNTQNSEPEGEEIDKVANA